MYIEKESSTFVRIFHSLVYALSYIHIANVTEVILLCISLIFQSEV